EGIQATARGPGAADEPLHGAGFVQVAGPRGGGGPAGMDFVEGQLQQQGRRPGGTAQAGITGLQQPQIEGSDEPFDAPGEMVGRQIAVQDLPAGMVGIPRRRAPARAGRLVAPTRRGEHERDLLDTPCAGPKPPHPAAAQPNSQRSFYPPSPTRLKSGTLSERPGRCPKKKYPPTSGLTTPWAAAAAASAPSCTWSVRARACPWTSKSARAKSTRPSTSSRWWSTSRNSGTAAVKPSGPGSSPGTRGTPPAGCANSCGAGHRAGDRPPQGREPAGDV